MAQPHNKKLGEYPMTTRGREQGPEKRYRRLRFPAFTAAKWTTANPLLQRGELGVETDTRKIKVGDGITYWNDLEYAKAYSDWGNIAGDITEQTDLVDFVNAAVAAEANIRSQADQQLQANIDNVAADLSTHEQDTNNPHNVTKAQVGLGNVDNTSDADKPVSTAQATAISDAVSTHNASETAHSNQFSQYRTSANQDTIDNQIKSDITNLQSTKADKATTLAGYGITDAYTKTEVDAKVSSVYRFRGSVATYANLPTTGQVVGDVWNVEDTGANYAWSGTEWDKLSETVDLTPYLTKTEASSTYATQSALAEVSTVAEAAQQTANAAGTTAAQALAGLDSKQDKLGFATATTAGIVRVGDGSQMVVNASTGDISLDGTKASGIRSTIGALASNQGSSNSGLILGIDASGNVVPTESSSGGRNIGDIFWTTRTDSALNGAVEANGAQYNFADVNGGDNNVQALLESGALPSVSIAKFDAMVAAQGGCDSFGYDSGTLYAWSGTTGLYYTKSETPSAGGHVCDSDGTVLLLYIIDDVSGLPNTIIIKSNTDDTETLTRSPQNDITSSVFKVPKKTPRILVRCQKPTADNNYTWYNLYADGWCEQGAFVLANAGSTAIIVNLAISMANTDYSVIGQVYEAYTGTDSGGINFYDQTTTTFKLNKNNASRQVYWQVSGYAAPAEYTKDKWDYQNVQVERPMVQLFNGATDDAVATCTEVLADVAGLKQTTDGMIDYVVESQEPTEANGYTWYRKYKSGWVEQGGFCSGTAENNPVTLAIEMKDTEYTIEAVNIQTTAVDAWGWIMVSKDSQTTTGFSLGARQGTGNVTPVRTHWQVSGMAA